jgi:hypothetical protein
MFNNASGKDSVNANGSLIGNGKGSLDGNVNGHLNGKGNGNVNGDPDENESAKNVFGMGNVNVKANAGSESVEPMNPLRTASVTGIEIPEGGLYPGGQGPWGQSTYGIASNSRQRGGGSTVTLECMLPLYSAALTLEYSIRGSGAELGRRLIGAASVG